MARITSEKATQMIGNKFDLVLVAAHRAREISLGIKSNLGDKNGPVVTALKEIEQGRYTKNDFDNFRKTGRK